jgi:hypothetical protein
MMAANDVHQCFFDFDLDSPYFYGHVKEELHSMAFFSSLRHFNVLVFGKFRDGLYENAGLGVCLIEVMEFMRTYSD